MQNKNTICNACYSCYSVAEYITDKKLCKIKMLYGIPVTVV